MIEDDILCSAINYVEKNGFYIFPQAGKVSCIKDWINAASKDTGRITQWFHIEFKGKNIGLVCGKKSGVIVLDVDVKHDQPGKESLQKLQEKIGALPETLVHGTPSGGYHYFFKYPKNKEIKTIPKLPDYPGLEILSDKHALTLPPSRIDGNEYKVLNDKPIASLPENLLLYLESISPPASEKNNADTDEEPEELKNLFHTIDRKTIAEGERNKTLCSIAGFLRSKGYEKEQLLSKLLEINNKKCIPPLPENEIVSIAESVSRYPVCKKKEDRKSIATQITEQAIKEIELFNYQDKAYATIRVNGHKENLSLRGTYFKNWISCRFFEKSGRSAGSQAITDVLMTLEGYAKFKNPEKEIFLRVTKKEDAVYIDLCNDRWEVIEVTGTGFQVIKDSPVKFRRTNAMKALPYPHASNLPGIEKIAKLRKYINVEGSDWILLVAWIIQSLYPIGAFPILVLLGQQGTGKTTVGKMLKSLIDPNESPLRASPKENRDLMIASNNAWCIAFDNLSSLTSWISDSLCRLSTGGGFSTRQLYTDDEELIIDAKRPIILNSIEDIIHRSDLLDRSVIINLLPIDEKNRKSENDLMKSFEQDKADIFSGILDALSFVLKNIDACKIEYLPRMADFGNLGHCIEKYMGWEDQGFLNAYYAMINQNNVTLLESDIVAIEIVKLMNGNHPWTGSATELLRTLTSQAGDKVSKQRGFPKNARALSSKLRRIAPNLKAEDIQIEMKHDGTKRIINITKE